LLVALQQGNKNEVLVDRKFIESVEEKEIVLDGRELKGPLR